LSSWLAVCVLPTVAWAAPIRLARQGRLVDSTGAPVDGAATLTQGLHAYDVR
jgi:hypothetical protein